MADTTFQLVIVSPDRTIYESEAKRILVPGMVQELAILPNHTPLYTELVKGTIKIDTADGKQKEVDVEGGIMRVRQNQVSIILGFETDIERKPPK